jgi:hypothetical protein
LQESFYLFPALQLAYNDKEKPTIHFVKRRRYKMAATLLFSVLFFFLPVDTVYGQEHVQIRGNQISKMKALFKIKGVNYGPWRPSTGPNKGYSYPSRFEIEKDLKLIKDANANTILVYDPPLYCIGDCRKIQVKSSLHVCDKLVWFGKRQLHSMRRKHLL